MAAVARALGLALSGKRTHCINRDGHRGGEDRHPSLVLYDDHYHCYACGAHGDAIDLVRAVRVCSYSEACTWLAALPLPASGAGASGPDGSGAPPRVGSTRSIASTTVTAVYRHLHDLTTPPAADSPGGRYLRRRGLDLDLASRCGVREVADVGDVWVSLVKDFGAATLQNAGLVTRSGSYLFVRHPLLFFFMNGENAVFVTARAVEPDVTPKELRPASVACPSPFHADLLHAAPPRIYLCEGCIDTLSALQLGLPAIGVPGAGAFADAWFDLLPAGVWVTVLFDADEAGVRAAADLRTRLRMRGFRADAVTVPKGKDVNDWLLLPSTEKREP